MFGLRPSKNLPPEMQEELAVIKAEVERQQAEAMAKLEKHLTVKILCEIGNHYRQNASKKTKAQIKAKQKEGGIKGADAKHRNTRLLKQWVVQQNPGTRKGTVYARELDKRAPAELKVGLEDSERVIRDYLDTRLKGPKKATKEA